MRQLWIWFGLAVGGVGAVVAGCHDQLPEPALPFPKREVPSQGPKPGPLVPGAPVPIDAAIPNPVIDDQAVIQTQPKFGAGSPADAGTDAVVLPRNPDAAVVRDAATPVR